MNRLFDDVFRGFDLAPLGSLGAERLFERGAPWPKLEISETDRDMKVATPTASACDSRWGQDTTCQIKF